MTRALLVAVALLTASCQGPDNAARERSTTTRRATTTVSTTSSTSSTLPAGPAPNGCDASQLHRVQPRADRTRYAVDATLDLDTNKVTGTLEAVFTPDMATDRIVVRLWPNGPDQQARGARMAIGNAAVDGQSVTISTPQPTTAVLASNGLPPGRPVTVAYSFDLTLPGLADDRLSRSGTTVRLGSWLPLLAWEPGAGWALEPPTTTHAEASSSITADFDVRFRAPAGLTVLASGEEIEPGRWRARAMPDWGASVGAFRIERGMANGVPVTVGVEASLQESTATYLRRVVTSLQALVQRYGAYPYPHYSLAITPGLRGGIEYPGHVMQGPGTNARTTPHEAAHMWFYSLVGSNQGRDPWLDEGLATWAEAMINGSYQSFRARAIPSDGRFRIGQPMTFWDQHESSYYRSVYVQPVHALAALGVSPAAVDCALARYVAANAYRVATPASLLRALQTVAPNARDVLARYGALRLDGP